MSISDYIGSIVKVKLNMGTAVEGRVTKISPTRLYITNVNEAQILTQGNNNLKIDSADISELDIISLPVDTSPDPPSSGTEQKSKPITIMKRENKSPDVPHFPAQAPNHSAFREFNGRKSHRNPDTFAVSTNNMSTDFDFQSSNKLFQKEQIFDEWKQQEGGYVKPKTDKLKSSEMVIPVAPLRFRKFDGDFLTDDKIPVRGLNLAKRVALFKRAVNMGLSYNHMMSVASLTISQMIIQLLGGSCRINTQNHNKAPVVVVLISSGDNGKLAASIALLLHQHNISVKCVVFVQPKTCEGLLELLDKSGCVVPNLQSLPDVVDLIVDGIQDRGTLVSWPAWLSDVIQWTAAGSVPLLVLDPQHPSQMPSDPPTPKWSCALGAPLLNQGKAGRLFLVDLGIPELVFTEEQIPYNSPYFDKFIIPIHRNDKFS